MDMENEQPKQAKRKKRHRIRKAGCALRILILIGLAVGVYYFLTSSVFNIDTIQVKGNKHFQAEQVIEIAKAKPGVNLFKAKVKKMEERLEAEPYIKNAEVKRKLMRRLVIRVEERVARAALKYGADFLLIDDAGFLLEKTDALPKLTQLNGFKLADMTLGAPIKVEQPEELKVGLELLTAMEENELFFKTVELTKNEAKVYIYDTLICKGAPEDILAAMSDLQIMLYDMYKQGIKRGTIIVGPENYLAFSPTVE